MVSATNSRPLDTSRQRLCCYTNATSQLQVIRIANISNWRFEQVVFPKQRLLFEAPSNAEIEVQTSYLGEAVLVTKIPSTTLEVRHAELNSLS
ncbi:MAG TPA: DUF1830 domain-containing protein [Chroococcales cyanobacterium]|jgi:hypothetical protein